MSSVSETARFGSFGRCLLWAGPPSGGGRRGRARRGGAFASAAGSKCRLCAFHPARPSACPNKSVIRSAASNSCFDHPTPSLGASARLRSPASWFPRTHSIRLYLPFPRSSFHGPQLLELQVTQKLSALWAVLPPWGLLSPWDFCGILSACVVLNPSAHQNSLGALEEHRCLGPTPRGSDRVWVQQRGRVLRAQLAILMRSSVLRPSLRPQWHPAPPAFIEQNYWKSEVEVVNKVIDQH